MKSKANIKGHPLHPILVSFPIALLTGALLLDLLMLLTGEQSYADAAVYALAGGLISALIAAIPGIIDYFFTVPPESSANQRALKHAMINACAVLVFAMAFLMRLKNDTGLLIIIAMEGSGVILLGIAGWLGGTLVVRNQIGVDHRYAEAGKWQEESIKTTADKVGLKNLDKLKNDQMKLLHVNGKRIVIAKTESGFAAFDDRCTHRGGSLADGVIICGTVQCPWHGSQFDVKTGALKAGPAKENIETYTLITEGESVLLHL